MTTPSPFRFSLPTPPLSANTARKRRKLDHSSRDEGTSTAKFAFPGSSPLAARRPSSRHERQNQKDGVESMGDAFSVEDMPPPKSRMFKPMRKPTFSASSQPKANAIGAKPGRSTADLSSKPPDNQTPKPHRTIEPNEDEQENTPPSSQSTTHLPPLQKPQVNPHPTPRPISRDFAYSFRSDVTPPRPPPARAAWSLHPLTPRLSAREAQGEKQFNSTPHFSTHTSFLNNAKDPPIPRPRFATPVVDTLQDAPVASIAQSTTRQTVEEERRIDPGSLADVFSPAKNRRGGRFVSGGLAEEVRGWVLDVGVGLGGGSKRGKGDEEGGGLEEVRELLMRLS